MMRRALLKPWLPEHPELAFCLNLNRLGATGVANGLFRAVSRLGDGVVWYALMALLPFVLGLNGLQLSLRMAVSGLLALALYRLVKRTTRRLRPYARHRSIVAHTAALDEYSFPSGHTLHAVLFTVLVATEIPILAWLLVPFALLVAVSRVVLGLHYPSDVIAGALMGALIALASAAIWPVSAF